jgi:hypothetical protein
MARHTSNYPIQHFLDRLVPEFWSCRTDFVEKLGYTDLETGRLHLDAWLDRGEGFYGFLNEVAAAYPDLAAELEKAIADTAAMKMAEGDPNWRERCRSEEAAWEPFIHAVGSQRIPEGICIFGVTGGHRKWTVIPIPEVVQRLPLEGQLPKLPEFMAAYKQQYHGNVPFFGKLTGFRFVRMNDYFQFDANGRLLEHVHERFRLGGAWVELR